MVQYYYKLSFFLNFFFIIKYFIIRSNVVKMVIMILGGQQQLSVETKNDDTRRVLLFQNCKVYLQLRTVTASELTFQYLFSLRRICLYFLYIITCLFLIVASYYTTSGYPVFNDQILYNLYYAKLQQFKLLLLLFLFFQNFKFFLFSGVSRIVTILVTRTSQQCIYGFILQMDEKKLGEK